MFTKLFISDVSSFFIKINQGPIHGALGSHPLFRQIIIINVLNWHVGEIVHNVIIKHQIRYTNPYREGGPPRSVAEA